MGKLSLIGMGLYDENGLTLRGLRAARQADAVYAEFYTSTMPGLSLPGLQRLLGKEVKILSRSDLEENAEHTILQEAKRANVALLTPGDPMAATTHVGLLLAAKRLGIPTAMIHSTSIVTAAAGVTGLELYKFGRTVTIPSPKSHPLPESVYGFIKANKNIGLHTLALLDIGDRELTIPEAIRVLLGLEAIDHAGIATENTLMVALARVDAPDCTVMADRAANLAKSHFGDPPYSIILPSSLHFVEAEALRAFARAPQEALEAHK
jgi:diphthine synthase